MGPTSRVGLRLVALALAATVTAQAWAIQGFGLAGLANNGRKATDGLHLAISFLLKVPGSDQLLLL